MTAPQHTVTPSDGVGHTPGPWVLTMNHLRGGLYHTVIIPGEDKNGNCFEPIDIHELDNGEANARLIAAAPELLEAVQRLIGVAEQSIYPKPDVGPDHPYAIICAAKEAVVKATGKTGGEA